MRSEKRDIALCHKPEVMFSGTSTTMTTPFRGVEEVI